MSTDESSSGRDAARCPPRARGRSAREARVRRPTGVGLFASVVVMALSATVLMVIAEPVEARPAHCGSFDGTSAGASSRPPAT